MSWKAWRQLLVPAPPVVISVPSMSNKTATGFTRAPPSARLRPALCSRTEHHAAFGRSAWLEARCERRDEAACTEDQVEDERGRVVPEADDEGQHDQRGQDCEIRIAVEERGNDADDSGRPTRGHGPNLGSARRNSGTRSDDSAVIGDQRTRSFPR